MAFLNNWGTHSWGDTYFQSDSSLPTTPQPGLNNYIHKKALKSIVIYCENGKSKSEIHLIHHGHIDEVFQAIFICILIDKVKVFAYEFCLRVSCVHMCVLV